MQLHERGPRHLLKDFLFYTVFQYNISRLVFGDNFGIIFHKYPYNRILSSHLHHLSVAALLEEAILLYTHLNAISNMNSDKQSLTLNVIVMVFLKLAYGLIYKLYMFDFLCIV